MLKKLKQMRYDYASVVSSVDLLHFRRVCDCREVALPFMLSCNYIEDNAMEENNWHNLLCANTENAS